jgi:hypothetical protein
MRPTRRTVTPSVVLKQSPAHHRRCQIRGSSSAAASISDLRIGELGCQEANNALSGDSLPPTGHRSHQSSHSCASPDPSRSLFTSCESLLNNCEISPLNRVYLYEKARLAVHPLAENDRMVDGGCGLAIIADNMPLHTSLADNALKSRKRIENKQA